MSDYNLKNIGNTLRLNARVDPEGRVSNYMRRNMRIVDLIPVEYKFLSNQKCMLENIINGTASGRDLLTYDYQTSIDRYQKICNSYGLDASRIAGLRLWLTDETSAQENFSNDYSTNLIEQGINSLGSKFGMLRQLNKSIISSGRDTDSFISSVKDGLSATESKLHDLNTQYNLVDTSDERKAEIKADIDALTSQMRSYSSTLTDLIPGAKLFQNSNIQSLASMFKNTMKLGLGIAIKGEAISMPKIWESSSYNPILNLNIKLVSPYGSQKAIQKYILEPLMYLLILAAPRSKNGLSYGYPSSVRVKTYGVTNINIGTINNIQIRRGGGDSPYNKYRQPLSLMIALTIMPQYNGFAALESDEDSTIDDITIKSFTDNINNISDSNFVSPNKINDITRSRPFTTVGDIIQSFAPFDVDAHFDGKLSNQERAANSGWISTESDGSTFLSKNEHYTDVEPVSNFAAGVYNPPVAFGEGGSSNLNPSPNLNSSVALDINNSDIPNPS